MTHFDFSPVYRTLAVGNNSAGNFMGHVQKCVRENVEEQEAFVLGSVSPTFVLKTHCEGKQASCGEEGTPSNRGGMLPGDYL